MREREREGGRERETEGETVRDTETETEREALEHRVEVPEGVALGKGRMPPLWRQEDTCKVTDG